MTTLKELLFSRACKIGLAVMLAVSMVPVAAFSTAPAFAEDDQAEQALSETSVDERTANLADSDDEASTSESDESADVEEAAGAIEGEAQLEGEPIEGTAATSEEAADEPVEVVEEASSDLDVSDFNLETLETTVEEQFSFWTPFRLFFGASDDFKVPLKSGRYTNWIDRLDLSGALDKDGVNYAQRFYDILVEGADNDKKADVLIDNTSFTGTPGLVSTESPASIATIGKAYGVDGTSGILVAIVDDPEVATTTKGMTAVEERVKQYVNETYGAFDRDYPSSFWRDVSFGTFFVRDKVLKQTMCFFATKSSTFDLRAQGYRSQSDIRKAIAAVDKRVEEINAAFTKTNATDYDRVEFYNDWLCKNNEYNTAFTALVHDPDKSKLADFQNEHPDVWSAKSALTGLTGEAGPVCEGYSRAMQLLCQRAGIGCVVVDGMTNAGAHMWNYVRIGSNWYGLDITWNDGNNKTSFKDYFLKGSNSGFDGPKEEGGHPVSNQFVANGTKFTNGPLLSAADYDPANVTFAGPITESDTFPYGEAIVLSYSSTTPGDVSYTLTDGDDIAVLAEATTLAETTVNGGSAVLRITGVGTISVKVTLSPTEEEKSDLTSTITIQAVPRPLTVSGTVLASKVYDGTLNATVMTNGQLEGALTADEEKLSVQPTSAYYGSVNAGTNVAGTATYKLTGDADTVKLYTLEASGTDASAKGTITKRPVTTYFALTNTRVLTTEELPVGTVRFEAATGNRGKLASDNLTPATSALKIQLSGMPSSMPTLAAGSSKTYDVTWTSSNSNVLTAINALDAAANYDVSLSTDTEQNTVTLTIVNLENTTVIDAESPMGGATYRVEARLDGINDDTVDKLTEAGSGYTSTESIISKLLESLRGQATKELADDRIAVYDMTLFVQDEDGMWEEATAENFPSDGVRVTLEYPEGTSGSTHSFYAAHMFTSESVGGGAVHKPGEIEEPEVMNGVDGPNFVLTGFSPVTLAWEDVPRNTQTADGQGGGIISPVSQNNTHQTGASAVSQTGDSLPVLSITVVALACIVLLVALAVRRNRHKNSDDKQ